jgi:hypothetical protein
MTIVVKIKNVYGNDTIYPVCEKARIFAALSGNKTITLHALAQIKLLGYEIAVEQKTL